MSGHSPSGKDGLTQKPAGSLPIGEHPPSVPGGKAPSAGTLRVRAEPVPATWVRGYRSRKARLQAPSPFAALFALFVVLNDMEIF